MPSSLRGKLCYTNPVASGEYADWNSDWRDSLFPSIMPSPLGGKLCYTDPMLTLRYSGNLYISFKYVATSSGNKFSQKEKKLNIGVLNR